MSYVLRTEFTLTQEQVKELRAIDVWNKKDTNKRPTYTKKQVALLDQVYKLYIDGVTGNKDLVYLEKQVIFGGIKCNENQCKVIVLHWLCNLQSQELTIGFFAKSLTSREAFRYLLYYATKEVK